MRYTFWLCFYYAEALLCHWSMPYKHAYAERCADLKCGPVLAEPSAIKALAICIGVFSLTGLLAWMIYVYGY